ncbi:MAG: YdcF family protein [Acetobacteraceae bacterium]|nr:YdcF family protein [Acetobacteraceae bacterium]
MLSKYILLLMIVPPLNLVIAILVGWLLLRTRPRLGRWIIGCALLLLLLLGIPAVAETLLAALETDLPTAPPIDKPPAAIIVLGGDIDRTQEGADVGQLTLDRLRTAAVLYRRTQLPVLVSGGVVIPGEPSVGEVMATSLQRDFQVPVRWVEPRSKDTWENAQDSAAMLKPEGITSAYVVTSAWHERRSLMAFSHTSLTVTPAPTPLDSWPRFIAIDFVPRNGNWAKSYYALHEWIGCVWYAIR